MTFNAGIEAAALLPCPFCGGEPTVQPQGKVRPFKIYCGNDDCMGPQTTAFDEKDCIVQWNTRPSPSAPVEQREAVAPEWIWYGERDGKPVISFGRWPKSGARWRYKLADIQPTEHDHPALPGSSRDEVLEECALICDNAWLQEDQIFADARNTTAVSDNNKQAIIDRSLARAGLAGSISQSIRALKSGGAK